MSSKPKKRVFLNPQTCCLHSRKEALFHVIPVPYEATVSYGKGTAAGPDAIIDASHYVEEYDGLSVPCESGIYVTPPLPSNMLTRRNIIGAVEKSVGEVLDQGKVPVVLGGEHSITPGAVAAFIQRGISFGVVHFDAHSDLRNFYQGSADSHACALRHVIDSGIPLFQIGVRSFDRNDPQIRKRFKVGHLDADEIEIKGISSLKLPKGFPKNIYISFDVDAFDCSLMPSTGTPEPGGLSWDQAVTALKKVSAGRKIIGFDTVELAPIKGLHAPDFVAAKLVYTIMGLVTRSV